jgi:oligopeptide/dipeptide ABC transporter ATP-binding protein
MSAIPEVNPELEMTPVRLKGEIPSPVNPPAGCRFHTRCAYVQDMCKTEIPQWREIEDGHFVACHFADMLTLEGVTSLDTVGGVN